MHDFPARSICRVSSSWLLDLSLTLFADLSSRLRIAYIDTSSPSLNIKLCRLAQWRGSSRERFPTRSNEVVSWMISSGRLVIPLFSRIRGTDAFACRCASCNTTHSPTTRRATCTRIDARAHRCAKPLQTKRDLPTYISHDPPSHVRPPIPYAFTAVRPDRHGQSKQGRLLRRPERQAAGHLQDLGRVRGSDQRLCGGGV